MAVTTTRAGAVIDALVAKCRAAAVFADPARVYDGPVTAGDTQWTQAVFIGFDGDWQVDAAGNPSPAAEYEAVAVDQQLVYVGNTSVQENLEVRCIAEAWSGDPDPKPARNTCLAMLAGVENVLRADPTLGIDGSTIATLQTGNLYYRFGRDGEISARIPFTVHVLSTLLTVPDTIPAGPRLFGDQLFGSGTFGGS